MNLFLAGIGFILLGGIFSLFRPDSSKGKTLVFFTGMGTLCILRQSIPILLGAVTDRIVLFFHPPIGPIPLILDPLAAFFVTVITLVSFLGTIYSIGYLRPYAGQKGYSLSSHYFLLSLFMASMLLVPVVQNALAFLFIWELMSLFSFLLILFEQKKSEVLEAGLNYLIAMQIGVMFLTIGFISIALKSHSWNFASFAEVFKADRSWSNGIFLVFFVGFGIKAGFVPFHTWLPKAHPAAPSHISAMMSGVMIKTGIYGILRMITFFPDPSLAVGYGVLFIAVASGILGVIYAIAEHDLKKLLAYHSVENIGIIGMGIGLGLLGLSYHNPLLAIFGFAGGILHVWNHALFKGLLFFGAGAVFQKTHQRNMELLGGLGKRMPYTAFFFLIGSLAICGLPLFNGFISEFLIFISLLNGFRSHQPFLSAVSVLSMGAMATIGALALLCFTKAFGVVFLGKPRQPIAIGETSEGTPSMLLPMGILGFFCLGLGVLPQLIFSILRYPLAPLARSADFSVMADLEKTLSHLAFVLCLLAGLTVIIYGVRSLCLKKSLIQKHRTWDCGYPATTTRMQYTAASYAAPFLSLAEFLVNRTSHKIKPEELFPQKASYQSHHRDIFESYVFTPAGAAIRGFLGLFRGIQSGNIQQYILYGLIFLVGVLIWTIGVIP